MEHPFLYIGNQVHLFAILMLPVAICYRQSCAGFSVKSQILYALVFVTRYLDLGTIFISYYNSVLKVIFIAITLLTICLMLMPFRRTYDRNNDSFSLILLLLPTAFVALRVNYNQIGNYEVSPIENDFVNTQTALETFWAFSIYLEAVAIVPQFYLIYKNGAVDPIVKYYLLTLAAYRFIYIMNWCERYLYENHWDSISFTGGLVQVIIYCLFFVYMFLTNGWKKNNKLQLPLANQLIPIEYIKVRGDLNGAKMGVRPDVVKNTGISAYAGVWQDVPLNGNDNNQADLQAGDCATTTTMDTNKTEFNGMWQKGMGANSSSD